MNVARQLAISSEGWSEMSSAQDQVKIEVNKLSLFYGDYQALHEISIQIPAREVTALIGPSGCGKSSFLRTINRMNDLIDGVRVEGQVRLDSQELYAPDIDLIRLRKRVGMVFQKSNPFPKSIFENVAYGPRIHGVRDRAVLDEILNL